MSPELEALRQQYEERTDKNQCVACGESLDPDDTIELLTGWSACYDCGRWYDVDGHRTILDRELSKRAREIGVAVENLPEDEKTAVYWHCEGW